MPAPPARGRGWRRSDRGARGRDRGELHAVHLVVFHLRRLAPGKPSREPVGGVRPGGAQTTGATAAALDSVAAGGRRGSGRAVRDRLAGRGVRGAGRSRGHPRSPAPQPGRSALRLPTRTTPRMPGDGRSLSADRRDLGRSRSPARAGRLRGVRGGARSGTSERHRGREGRARVVPHPLSPHGPPVVRARRAPPLPLLPREMALRPGRGRARGRAGRRAVPAPPEAPLSGHQADLLPRGDGGERRLALGRDGVAARLDELSDAARRRPPGRPAPGAGTGDPGAGEGLDELLDRRPARAPRARERSLMEVAAPGDAGDGGVRLRVALERERSAGVTGHGAAAPPPGSGLAPAAPRGTVRVRRRTNPGNGARAHETRRRGPAPPAARATGARAGRGRARARAGGRRASGGRPGAGARAGPTGAVGAVASVAVASAAPAPVRRPGPEKPSVHPGAVREGPPGRKPAPGRRRSARRDRGPQPTVGPRAGLASAGRGPLASTPSAPGSSRPTSASSRLTAAASRPTDLRPG